MARSYSYFAKYYDSLTLNVNYEQRAAYFGDIIKKYNAPGNLLLDAGCGTGSLSVALAKRGYDVIGVDYSPQMLGEAQNKAAENELSILFLMQDIRRLDLYGTVDIAMCVQDTLNHLKEGKDVLAAFQSINLFLDPDGLFIFDLNTVYKHQAILANNAFVLENDEVYCVWQNTLDAHSNSVEIELDFFEKQGETYERFSETFSENAYPLTEIEDMLAASGFEVLALFEADTFEKPTSESQRVIYVAKNIKPKTISK